MRIALIGYGKMGKTIEKLILEKGHTISYIIDIDRIQDINQLKRTNTDAVIEFTEPTAALNNVKACLANGVSVVSGTTGWEIPVAEIQQICTNSGAAFLQSSNFNIGTHLFFMLNRIMAGKSAVLNYKVSIEEVHHVHKKDKPSGTAITLARSITENSTLYNDWCLISGNETVNEGTIPLTSVREGEVTGIHTAKWESDSDIISITHNARNRNGFATGALMAAEFLQGKKGLFTMNDLLTEIIQI